MHFGTNTLEKVAYDFSTNVLVKFSRRYQSNLSILQTRHEEVHYIHMLYLNSVHPCLCFMIWTSVQLETDDCKQQQDNMRILIFTTAVFLSFSTVLGVDIIVENNCETEYYTTDKGTVCGAIETTESYNKYKAFYGMDF